jgi:hypothetical protein
MSVTRSCGTVSRGLQAQSADVFLDGLADHCPEDAVEVMRREAGDAGQSFQQ